MYLISNLINKIKNSLNKNILVVGAGKWALTMAKFFLKNGCNVSYATRNNELNIEFEKKINSQKLNHFDLKEEIMFDLISICVRPKDIYFAWSKFKYLSNKFLIEKPGGLSTREFENIVIEAERYNKKIFINYEFIYCQTTKTLKEKIKLSKSNILSINLFWEKPLSDEGGLEWRLLPHLIAELFFYGPKKLTLKNYKLDKKLLKLEGYFDTIPISINIGDSKVNNHYSVVKLKNNLSYFKNREDLFFNNQKLKTNSSTTLANVMKIIFEPNEIFHNENILISKNVLEFIEKIK